MQPQVAIEAIRPLFDRMASTRWPVLRQSVTAIAVIQDGRPIQWGTGTFFHVVEDSFVVTACHVWEEAVRHGFSEDLHIYRTDGVNAGDAQVYPVPLTGKLYRTKDPFDVAIFELDSATVAALGGCHFLRLNEVQLRPKKPGWCWVYGYPQESVEEVPSQSLVRFNPFFMLASICRRDLSLENYDRNHHFLLEAARDDLWHRDGTPAKLPNRLNGISGCSIWQSDWPKDNSPENWDPNSFRIVGVQTSYYRPPSVIKATPWAAVANVLYQARPDPRTVIEMHLGPAW